MLWTLDRLAIGKRIADKIANLEQKKLDLASLINRDKTRISKYLKGEELTIETLGMLASALGCTTDYLLGIGAETAQPDEKKSQYSVVAAGKNFLVTENSGGYTEDPMRELKLDIVQRTVSLVETGSKQNLELLITFLLGLEAREETAPGVQER